MEWVVHDVPGEAEMRAAFALRYRVFVQEQRVPVDLERDEYDAVARHVVLMAGERALGTGRLLTTEAGAKVQRVAVDSECRGLGLGRAVMEALERLAAEAGESKVLLASQASAIPFYERLGYVGYGERFMEAGIEHRWMAKQLPPPDVD